MLNKNVVTQEPIEEARIDQTGVETFVVELISDTIKRAAKNQATRKPENKMPNVS